MQSAKYDEEISLLKSEDEETMTRMSSMQKSVRTAFAVGSLLILGSVAALYTPKMVGMVSKPMSLQSNDIPKIPGTSICPATFVKGVTPDVPPDGCIYVASHNIFYLNAGDTAIMFQVCSTADAGPKYFDSYDLAKLSMLNHGGDAKSVVSSIIRGPNTLVTFYSGPNFDGMAANYPNPIPAQALTDRIFPEMQLTNGELAEVGKHIVNDDVRSFVFTSLGTTPIDNTCGTNLQFWTGTYKQEDSTTDVPPGCIVVAVNQLEALKPGHTSPIARVCATSAVSPIKLDAHALQQLGMIDADGNSLISSIVQGPEVKVQYFSGAKFSGFYDDWSPGPLTIKTYQSPPYKLVNDNVKSIIFTSKATAIPGAYNFPNYIPARPTQFESGVY